MAENKSEPRAIEARIENADRAVDGWNWAARYWDIDEDEFEVPAEIAALCRPRLDGLPGVDISGLLQKLADESGIDIDELKKRLVNDPNGEPEHGVTPLGQGSYLVEPYLAEVSDDISEERSALNERLRGLLNALESAAEPGSIFLPDGGCVVESWPSTVILEAYEIGQILSNKTTVRRLAGYQRMKTGGRIRPDLSALKSHYDSLAPELDDAKQWIEKRFKQWGKNPPKNYKQTVRDAYPVLSELHDDLIERLCPAPNLTNSTWNKMEKKNHDVSKVSHIALEAAARKCGCKKYQYSIRWLFTNCAPANISK